MKYYSIFYILISSFVIACQSSNNKVHDNGIKPSGVKIIRYSALELDSIQLEQIPTSFSGKLSVIKNNLYFVDDRLCWVFKFSNSGKYVCKYIGQGKGPNELPLKFVEFSSPTTDGGYFFIGPSWDCFHFDKNFKRIDDYEINWHSKHFGTPIQPDTTMMDGYSLAYYFGEIKIYNNKVYLPLLSLQPSFNPTIPSYSKQARILALMDLENGYVEKTFGRLSQLFTTKKNIAPFSFAIFDLGPAEKILISYPPDSLIYVSDINFNISKIFGFEGRGIDKNYNTADSISEFIKNLQLQKKEKGYYRSVRFLPERLLLFRSYQKSGKAMNDGLQIYQSDTLIADLDVPLGFNVEGYITPYFYSNAFIDEDKGVIKVYKFRLPS